MQEAENTQLIANSFTLLKQNFRLGRILSDSLGLPKGRNFLTDPISRKLSIEYRIQGLKTHGLASDFWTLRVEGKNYSLTTEKQNHPSIAVKMTVAEWLNLLGSEITLRQCVDSGYIQGPDTDIEYAQSLGLFRPVGYTIQYLIEGPGGGAWHAIIRGDTCVMQQGTIDSPSFTLRLSSQEWLALLSAQIRREDIHEGKLQRRDKNMNPSDIFSDGLLGPIEALRKPCPAWIKQHGFRRMQWFIDCYFPGYEPDHGYFIRTSSQCAIRWRGPMGLFTGLAALKPNPFPEITRPLARLLCLSWLGYGVIVLTALALHGFLPQTFAVETIALCAILALALSYRTSKHLALSKLEPKVRQSADFYSYALKAGLLTLVSTIK